MDQDYLLSHAVLTLSKDLKMGPQEGDALIVKNEPNKGYLVVSVREWKILQEFKKPQNLIELMPVLIKRRACPELNLLYELILKAYAAGVLQEQGQELKLHRAMHWPLEIRSDAAQFFSILMFLVCMGSLLFKPPVLPNEFWHVMVPYLLVLLLDIICGLIFSSNFLV